MHMAAVRRNTKFRVDDTIGSETNVEGVTLILTTILPSRDHGEKNKNKKNPMSIETIYKLQ
jgi:hypothetical protein